MEKNNKHLNNVQTSKKSEFKEIIHLRNVS